MFNILSYKRNAYQNYTKIPSYPTQIGNYQENSKQTLERMWGEKGTSYAIVGNAN
jgi:hypothetical protein